MSRIHSEVVAGKAGPDRPQGRFCRFRFRIVEIYAKPYVARGRESGGLYGLAEPPANGEKHTSVNRDSHQRDNKHHH